MYLGFLAEWMWWQQIKHTQTHNMLLKTIRKFLKKFHLFGCHRKKNDEFLANQSTVPRPHGDEPWWQKVTMSSLNSNWVNISYWQQQQYCGYIFTASTLTPRQETQSSTRRTGKIWFRQECLETRDRENCLHWSSLIFLWSWRSDRLLCIKM